MENSVEARIEGMEAAGRDTLNLHGLGLREVPEVVLEFPELAGLNLSGNKLMEIPDFVVHLPRLFQLNVGENPLKRPPL